MHGQIWIGVAEVTGAQVRNIVHTGLTNSGLAKPSEYRIYAVGNLDTTFTYRVEVLSKIARSRREKIAAFVTGVAYACRALF